MQGKRCAPPRGGGSAAAAIKYILGEELTAKVEHDRERDNPLTPEQRGGLVELYAEARERSDLGVGAIWAPSGGGTRPSAIYARGVTSLETAALDIEAVVRTQPRVKQPVQHYVISLGAEETKTISDEQLIRAAENALDRAGWDGHAAVFTVHRDTDNAHCHVALASVHADTLRAWNRQSDYYRLHRALREAETQFKMQHENGLAIVRDQGLPTERIEWASLETRTAWRSERQAERLEDMARSFLAESDGLESEGDRHDRLVYAIRDYLEKTAARGEVPLRADLHVIAARLTTTLEQTSDGTLRARLMQRAPEGAIAREATDTLGDTRQREARWEPTGTVFELEIEMLAPSPLDSVKPGVSTTEFERAAHAAALIRRDWLRDVGDVDRSEAEVVEVVRADPGRVSRDILSAGAATFSAEDFDRWASERISGDWMEISNYAQREDATLEVLSADSETPLYSTKAQRALEASVLERATRLARERDPLFNRAALTRAIGDEEQSLGITFSAEQLRVFDLLEYRYAMVQGDAGTGKSTLMAVQRRYCEITEREIAGFATSQLAAENLGLKAGIRSVNTARAQALEDARGEEMIHSQSRAILDETSMLSLESADAMLRRIEEQGAGAIFIGDLAQLPNIAAGDTGRVLTAAAQETGRYAEVTQVFRQSGPEVEWMRAAVPVGGRAIREGDAAGFRAYLEEFVDRGHVVFHEDRKSEIDAKARDVVEATQNGVRVLAPGFSRQDCLYTNRAIRAALGHQGTGITYRFARGVREISPNDRVIFEKNAESRIGVLNGYTGTVKTVSENGIEVELDSGRRVLIDPKEYPHIDYGWSTTTHKSQGRGDPLVIPTLAKNDDARSAHVALTRCETGLRVHTRLDRDELLSHLSSPASLRPKDDALLFEEIVRRTGGPDTFWAISVRSAMAKENDPLREEHRAEMRERTETRDRTVLNILQRYNVERAKLSPMASALASERRERRELGAAYKTYELESFVVWATRRRMTIERSAGVAGVREAERITQGRRNAEHEHTIERDVPTATRRRRR